MEDIDIIPWYRQFWPWFVFALPAAAVAASFVTLFLAGSEPAMVVDDYGQIAKVTTRRAERARLAAELGLDARLSFSGQPGESHGQVIVSLQKQSNTVEWPTGLLLQLIHPTQATQDRLIPMAGLNGHYSAVFTRPEGRYYVTLTDAAGQWRLAGELERGASALRLVAAGVDE